MNGWKMSFLLGFPIFRGYVKLRVNIILCQTKLVHPRIFNMSAEKGYFQNECSLPTMILWGVALVFGGVPKIQSFTKDTKWVEKKSRNVALKSIVNTNKETYINGHAMSRIHNMNTWHSSKRCGCLNFVWTPCANMYQPKYKYVYMYNIYVIRIYV